MTYLDLIVKFNKIFGALSVYKVELSCLLMRGCAHRIVGPLAVVE